MNKFKSLMNKLTLEEKISMIHGAGLFRSGSVDRLSIPSLLMSDGPNGVRQEFHDDSWDPQADTGDFASYLPSCTCLASTWNPDLAFAFGQVLGSEARGRGKDVILAPGINIKRTPLCGRNFEYLSEDPSLISAMAVPVIQGIQENDVAACVKHFALNNQEQDRMSVNVSVDEKTLHELYLYGFRAAILQGHALSVMGAYNRFEQEFCCESRKLLVDILREQWKYEGVVISDWGGVHHTKEAALHGVDIEMSVTSDFDDYNMADPLKKQVENGEIPEEAIDQKVGRILDLMDKLRIGSPDRIRGEYNSPEHQQILEKIAEEGIVLLKNEKGHLPLSPDKKILVVGDNANRSHAPAGGSSEIKALYDITPLLGIRMTAGYDVCHWLPGYSADDSRSLREKYKREVMDALPDYDEVIFIGGLDHTFDTEGSDRKDMKLPYGQDDLITSLAEATENLTVVLINGSPVEMPWIDKVHALIQTSYMGMQGGRALGKILFGLTNPSGKLPETYPEKLEDTPTSVFHSYPGEIGEDGCRHVNYSEGLLVGYRYYTTENIPVLFPFGHGLSYSRFSFHNFRVSLRDMGNAGEVQAVLSFEIQNNSKREGKETLQLYVGFPGEDQPKMILRAFRKISLKPAEKRRESLTLSHRDFASYAPEKKCFVTRAGTYRLYAGTSANDILYETEIELTGEYDCL